MQKKLIGVDASAKNTLPYSPGVEVDGVLYTSGMLPIDSVTGEIVGGDVKAQTRQVLENLDNLLKSAGYTRSDVVKTAVFMTDLSHFAAMNELYAEFFSKNFPARTTVQVGALPRGAMVEIELIARK
ncbi:MAG: Rid family detoxifying hydrolase [Elusimicrobiaceae bacterium]|nr:Rid family detoxifying hydrolase [Elusimicrobiaceae bacterium]